MLNQHVRFGRSIRPVTVPEVQRGRVSILFNKLSANPYSSNVTVGVEPWVVKVFGLEPDQFIEVLNVFEGHKEPLTFNDELVILNSQNNTVLLPISGVYQLRVSGKLGELVCIAYPLSAMEEKAKTSAAISNPQGVQANKPNTFFDGSPGREYSQDLIVGGTPMVIRAFGLTTQVIELHNVFERKTEQVVEYGEPVQLDAENTTLVVHISGVYRLKMVGSSKHVKVVANYTNLGFEAPYLKRGLPGEPGRPGDPGPEGPQGPPGDVNLPLIIDGGNF